MIALDTWFPSDLLKRKLVVSVGQTEYRGRLRASDAFKYSSTFIPRRDVAILANQDIYFDDSLSLILSETADISIYTAYFLSRYQDRESGTDLDECRGHNFSGSHDAFIFIPPLPTSLIKQCNFELGSWGIEARLLYEFEKFGIKGRNPCFDIKSWHVHTKREKSYMPTVNTDGKSRIAFPDFLQTKFKSVEEELWGMNLNGRKYCEVNKC